MNANVNASVPQTDHGIVFTIASFGAATKGGVKSTVASGSYVHAITRGNTTYVKAEGDLIACIPADRAVEFLRLAPPTETAIVRLVQNAPEPVRVAAVQGAVRSTPTAAPVSRIVSSPATSLNFSGRDTIATDEARAVGLGWTVSTQPISATHAASGVALDMGGFAAVVRDDTRQVFGIVGKSWKPVQNDVMLRSLDPLVELGAEWVGAGSFRGGATVWGQIGLGLEREIVEGDTVRPYVLVRNAHDGTGSCIGTHTAVRVVCWNTLTHATQEGMALWNVRHTGGVEVNLARVQEILKALRVQADANLCDFAALTRATVTRAQVEEVTKLLLPDPADREMARALRNAETARETVVSLFDGAGRGSDMKGVRGTAWGLWNAATEYADWTMAQRARNDENRTESRLAGDAARFKAQAYTIIRETVGV
jgi:phage/plasmid-like protein (TIGR03299 family)